MTGQDAPTTQLYSIYIEAPAQQCWDAITTSELVQDYGYGGAVEIELREGGVYRNLASEEMRSLGMPEVVVTGSVLKAEPPRLLVLHWKPVWLDEPETTLTWEITPQGDRLTRVTLTHELSGAPETAKQVAGGGDAQNGGGGWPWVLSGLKTRLETGHVMS